MSANQDQQMNEFEDELAAVLCRPSFKDLSDLEKLASLIMVTGRAYVRCKPRGMPNDQWVEVGCKHLRAAMQEGYARMEAANPHG